MAGGSVADLYDVFALGLQREILLKGRDAVNFCVADSDGRRRIRHHFLRKIPEFTLDILKNGNDMRLVAVVGIEYFVECGFLLVRHTYLLIGSFDAYRFIIMGFRISGNKCIFAKRNDTRRN